MHSLFAFLNHKMSLLSISETIAHFKSAQQNDVVF